jgi:hypothetical protein
MPVIAGIHIRHDYTRADQFKTLRYLGFDFTQHNELQKIDPRQVNIKNSTDDTALHICVRMGFYEAAALLLSLGADVYLTDTSGESPISFLNPLRIHKPLCRDQESIRLLFQRSVTLTTITSVLSYGIGKRSSLNLLPIELIRLLDVMLFEPVTVPMPLSLS